jgi:tetratricopeptide (TPR) repeat protein
MEKVKTRICGKEKSEMYLRKTGIAICLSMILYLIGVVTDVFPQQVDVQEEMRTIRTYPYSDPDPLPTRGIQSKIYPYNRFDGYSQEAIEKEWKVITFENPYIRLFVLPEVGGKIWGATEKSTNREFIYLNQVLKFRDIAMRGPWTSGGIEFNFGLIGHSPWTSSPVDYVIQSNDDGSKSCVIGSMDLSSRTQWRVKISLSPDKAYFETKNLWYNPTPFNTSYYHWMNGAFRASDDFKLYFPGRYTIGHSGRAHLWPVDEQGRDVSYYRNNNFGSSKSYHVLGKYTEFSGGYWENSDFGFGHWAYYDDLPGQKYWVWSLFRDGAIWEDLLTDSDGQYVEVQMGRLFNQASTNSGFETPFTQMFFAPYTTDRWQGLWFPVKDIGGLVDASPYGALNVIRDGDTLRIGINALQALDKELSVIIGGERIYSTLLDLEPMGVFENTILLPSADKPLEIKVGKDILHYTSDPENKNLNRPVESDKSLDPSSAESLFQHAEEFVKIRQYQKALNIYLECLELEPNHSRALSRVAEIYCRRAEYYKALDYVVKVLQYNAYDADANFIYGVIYRELGNLPDAKESFGWAARSMQYRSASYTQIAEIYIKNENFKRAERYAEQALDYDRYNLNAYKALAIACRKQNRTQEALKILNQILNIDPLNHWARYEQYLLIPDQAYLNAFTSMIQNEFPHETYLEIAMMYVCLDLKREAVQLLKLAPPYPTVYYWLAYLTREDSEKESIEYLEKAITQSPRLVFPFRQESIPVLRWADEQKKHWKTSYYLGLIYWNLGRILDAVDLFKDCSEIPNFPPFYLSRGNLLGNAGNADKALNDYLKAFQLDKNEWRTWLMLGNEYLRRSEYENALDIFKQSYERFPDNFILGMGYAKSLLHSERFEECIAVLENIHILPYEGAREGHDIYEQVYVFYALENYQKGKYSQTIKLLEDSKLWPEHLGVGAPHNPDTRLQDYAAGLCYQKMGNERKADSLFKAIYNYTVTYWTNQGWNHYVGALILKRFGESHKADQLIDDWSAVQDGDFYLVDSEEFNMAAWGRAKFRNEIEKIQQIENLILQQTSYKRRANRNFITLVKAMQVLAE